MNGVEQNFNKVLFFLFFVIFLYSFMDHLTTFNILSNQIILNCRFLFCFSSNNGGAILLGIQNLLVLIADSLFFSCRATNNGGSIFIINLINQINISKCCFYNSTSYEYCVIYSYSNNHLILLSSINLCPEKSNICYNIVVGCYKGNQLLNNINSSYTNAFHHSGIHQNSPISTSTKFITFFNQHNSQFFNGFNYVSYKPITTFINYINNSCSLSLFYINNVEIVLYSNVIFINNLGPLTIISTNYYNGGKLELINSYFNTNINPIGSHLLLTSNIFFNNQNLIPFNFLIINTWKCENIFKISFQNIQNLKYFLNFLFIMFINN